MSSEFDWQSFQLETDNTGKGHRYTSGENQLTETGDNLNLKHFNASHEEISCCYLDVSMI